MCARCALVSRTFDTAGAALFPSGEDEQPASAKAANSQARTIGLLGIRGSHEVAAVPPAAAECLEQRGGVGEAVGFGLDLAEPGLLIGLVGVQHREIGGIAILILKA